MTAPRAVYVETLAGAWREVDGVMDGPHSRESLGFAAGDYIPQCQTVSARGACASLSFGCGYGLRSDNEFTD